MPSPTGPSENQPEPDQSAKVAAEVRSAVEFFTKGKAEDSSHQQIEDALNVLMETESPLRLETIPYLLALAETIQKGRDIIPNFDLRQEKLNPIERMERASEENRRERGMSRGHKFNEEEVPKCFLGLKPLTRKIATALAFLASCHPQEVQFELSSRLKDKSHQVRSIAVSSLLTAVACLEGEVSPILPEIADFVIEAIELLADEMRSIPYDEREKEESESNLPSADDETYQFEKESGSFLEVDDKLVPREALEKIADQVESDDLKFLENEELNNLLSKLCELFGTLGDQAMIKAPRYLKVFLKIPEVIWDDGHKSLLKGAADIFRCTTQKVSSGYLPALTSAISSLNAPSAFAIRVLQGSIKSNSDLATEEVPTRIVTILKSKEAQEFFSGKVEKGDPIYPRYLRIAKSISNALSTLPIVAKRNSQLFKEMFEVLANNTTGIFKDKIYVCLTALATEDNVEQLEKIVLPQIIGTFDNLIEEDLLDTFAKKEIFDFRSIVLGSEVSNRFREVMDSLLSNESPVIRQFMIFSLIAPPKEQSINNVIRVIERETDLDVLKFMFNFFEKPDFFGPTGFFDYIERLEVVTPKVSQKEYDKIIDDLKFKRRLFGNSRDFLKRLFSEEDD